MSISLCMIVKNEEKYIDQAIASVKDIVDEIIIVDTGSTDATKEKAKKWTQKIVDVAWDNDFAEARNVSIEQATKEWILVLDADEVIAKKDHEKIKALAKDEKYDAYAFIQASYTNEITQFGFSPLRESTEETKNFLGYISCNIIRLFKNKKGIKFSNPVHESVDAMIEKERVKKTEIVIHHYQFEKGAEKQREKQLQYLKIYEEKKDQFANKAKLYRDMGIIYANFKQEYEKAISYFQKSLEYNENNIKTYAGLLLCYILTRNKEEAGKIVEICEKKFPGSREVLQFKGLVSGM